MHNDEKRESGEAVPNKVTGEFERRFGFEKCLRNKGGYR
jgi:hypothetical protein